MPKIYDNIEQQLLPALRQTLELAHRADFCVGYFNLRGWKQIDSFIEQWTGGEGHCCRLLVGMQKLPAEELREARKLSKQEGPIDNKTAFRLKNKLAEEFRNQLTIGAPTNEDEAGLRRLVAQIKAKKVVVKLFLRHPLHAKLYLLFRPDPINPMVSYLGSSNLTVAGLARQGELNVDVLDHDTCLKLAKWFDDRWDDRWCLDISEELVRIIEESWAREELIPPYHIYVKMAYHLSHEARAGLSEFRIPRDFGKRLFEFQTAAVKIAAHHLNKRGGVLIGDVVGLGKTLMATALARIFEDDYGLETLIICPKNLVKMWEDYRDQYRLRGRVISLSRVMQELPQLRRFRLVLIDESHNLRNREGKRYRAIREYIQENDSRCILLTATPYNKTYLDLSNQLRLFIPEDQDLGVRPEQLLRELGETNFVRLHQCSVRSLAAFEKSEFANDWRELMRLYLVRRTRSFIQANYAETDAVTNRKFITFEDGTLSYFPTRAPKTVKFDIDDGNPRDQYAQLYAEDVVETINGLNLPRYGLGQEDYLIKSPNPKPTPTEESQLQGLSRAGKRLMGFCRTNLFKRLESSGQVFLQSIERHILRNFIFLHAIENEKPLPIGPQDAALLDARINDTDEDLRATAVLLDGEKDDDEKEEKEEKGVISLHTEESFTHRAAEVYATYAHFFKHRFKWLSPHFFTSKLTRHLRNDAQALLAIMQGCGKWDSTRDAKLEALYQLLTKRHRTEKVIVFTQFADTVHYLETQLQDRDVTQLAGVTGNSADPTDLAWQFSPVSNNKRKDIQPEKEFRVLIATDVLSEGQNLQDACIVVNYDLPWAIIRLIQRAGRVDRIGQMAEKIWCYSFLPADGVERIIRLRERVRKRLFENAEVVGTDEAFFEDDGNDQAVIDLYHEKAGILDDEPDTEVDLASYAYEIWHKAIKADPSLQKTIPGLPPVVYSTKPHQPAEEAPEGALVYLRNHEGNDALAWMDRHGQSVTESQHVILQAASCSSDTPALPRHEKHHQLVQKGVELMVEEEKLVGGQLGRPSSARRRTYERLQNYAEEIKGTLFESQELLRAIQEIYGYPLRQSAIDTLNRQLRSGVSNELLAQLVMALRDEDRLCLIHEEEQEQEPSIICSLGLSVEE